MVILPVVQRELSSASRKWAPYGTRLWIATAALLVASWLWLVLRARPNYMIGSGLFQILSFIAHTQVLIIGTLSAADSLSREKREGTLGLLFLTDLKSHDIVLGKLAASSCGVLYSVMALIPILGLPLLIGGVSGAEFGRVVLVLINNLFFATAVGVLSSACFHQARWAQSAALTLVAGLTLVLPALVLLFRESPWGAAWPQWKLPVYHAMVLSPGYSAWMSRVTAPGPALPDLFMPSVAAVHLMAWGALVVACWVLPRAWQDRPSVPRKAGLAGVIDRMAFGAAGARRAGRRQWLDQNPFLWLASRNRLQNKAPWIVLGFLGLVGFYASRHSSSQAAAAGLMLGLAVVMHGFLLLSVGLETPRQLAADRQSGALELLLSTGLSLREIIAGQHRALRRMFGWPLACVLGVHVVSFAMPLARRHLSQADQSLWIMFWAWTIAGLLASLWALGWVGLWTAVKHNRSCGPGAEALLRICVAPPVALLALLAGWTALIMFAPRLAPPPPVHHPARLSFVWLGLVCLNSVLHALWARHNLEAHFRAEAAEPLQPQRLYDSVIAFFNKLRFWRPRVPA